MRNTIGLILLSLPLTLSAKEDDYSLNSSFSLWGQYVYMKRTHTYDSNLINTSESLTTTSSCGCEKKSFTLCDSKDIAQRFHYEPGYRVGAKYMTKRSVWEASYMSISDWNSSCEKSAEGLLYFSSNPSFTLHDFTKADNAEAHYRTNFEEGELNYFRYLTGPRDYYFTFCWLGGLRYPILKEKLGIFFNRGADTSSYTVDVKNHIYGVQTGIGLQCNFTQRFFWDFIAKIGVGYDEASQKTALGDYNNRVMIRNYWKTGYSFPLILDGRVKIAFLLEDWVDLHVGYEIIYFNGIAVARTNL
ncbi:MAG: hypothetical protein LVR00_02505 [Rhabdochlamydiaceae bacterium]|jgi:hypothetical protein